VTEAQKIEFLEHMRNGMRRGAAAEVMGLTRREVIETIESDEELSKNVLDAEAMATEHVEEALYQSAVTGSVAAAKLWLELRKPKPSMLPMIMPDSPGESGDDLEDILRLTRE
jgi:hypothetical protein